MQNEDKQMGQTTHIQIWFDLSITIQEIQTQPLSTEHIPLRSNVQACFPRRRRRR